MAEFCPGQEQGLSHAPNPLDRQTGGGRTLSEPLFPGADTHHAYHIHKGCGFSGCDQLATADSLGVALFLNSGSCC